MAKRKRKPKNPVVGDLPQNPEFQAFAENVREIMSVPKEEIDRRAAKEKKAKETK